MSYYEPLTIESFANNVRKLEPKLKLASDDSIISWAEAEPNYATYFKSQIANPKPYGEDGLRESFHNPDIPVGTMMPNPAYVQDYQDYVESKDPQHLKYLGFNVEKMVYDFGAGLAGAMGTYEDPEGFAKFRTNALEVMSDRTRWMPSTSFWFKALAKLSKGFELDESDPEYKVAKEDAKEWYSISKAYIDSGNAMAAQRMSEDPALRGYFRWMSKNPMRLDNFFHAEQFQRAMAEMAPSVSAMAGMSAITGGGALVAGATMMGLEGSGMYADAIRLYTEEGLPKKDEHGNYIIDPKTKEPIRETIPFEEAAPLAGQTALVYSAIAAPLETFQVGRATRLLNIAPQARRSFILKMADKAIRKKPKTAQGIAWVADFGIEAIEGGAIEWLQSVNQMSAMKAMEEGYGNTQKEALHALAKELGPIPGLPFHNMFSEEIGMSDEAKEAFLLGMVGEAGFGTIGGAGRRAWEKGFEGKPFFFREAPWAGFDERDYRSTQTTTKEVTPTTSPEFTDVGPGEQAANQLVANVTNSNDKGSAALSYIQALIGQGQGPARGQAMNRLIFKAGGSGDEQIDKLIKAGTSPQLEVRPEMKAFQLLTNLKDDPEIKNRVVDEILKDPVLSAGVAKIQKEALVKSLPKKDRGTQATPSKAVDVIRDMDDAEVLSKLDMIKQFANEKLEEEGLDAKIQIAAEAKFDKARQVQADKKYQQVSSDKEDLALANVAGFKGTDKEKLAQYRKYLGKDTKKPPRVDIKQNINKLDSPGAHLSAVQRQSGSESVKKILEGKGKKRVNNTTLNKIQKEVLSSPIPANEIENRRGEIIELVKAKLIDKNIGTTKPISDQIKSKPIRKKVVKQVSKKKTIPLKEVIPSTGEITVFRDREKSTIKVKKSTDNVVAAISSTGSDYVREDGMKVMVGGLISEEATKEATDADTLIVQGDQAGLITQMQQLNVQGADKIVVNKETGKVNYTKADAFIKDFFKDSFKYIRYNNKQLKQKDVEFFDISDGKSYSVNPKVSEQYAKQRKARDKKKQPAIKASQEDIAMAQAMGLSISDYMKALNKDKAPAGETVEYKGTQYRQLELEPNEGLPKIVSEDGFEVAKGTNAYYTISKLFKSEEAPAYDIKFSPTQGPGGEILTDSAKEASELVQPRIKGKNVVDLGSGKDILNYRRALIGAGAKRVAGVDPIFAESDHKTDMLTFLKEQPDNSIDVITMNAIEFSDITNAAIISGKDAFKYQKEVFKEISRTVKPGGSLMGSSTTDFLDIPGWAKSEEANITVYDKPKETSVKDAETAIDDIIGKPNVSKKLQNQLDAAKKKGEAAQQEQLKTDEELDSLSDQINDKLDDDLCI